MPFWRHVTAILLCALSMGCQTSMLKSFNEVENGMDKHQVLEAMGSPTATTRFHGRDRWIYRFYDDSIRFEKEVHFLDGVVIYKGDPWTPPEEKSALAADKAAAAVETAAQEDQAAKEKARKENADQFAEYEKKARHNADVQYLPKFEEIK